MSQAEETDGAVQPRKPYSAPRMIRYGEIAKLTASGSGSNSESNYASCRGRFPARGCEIYQKP